MAKDAVIHARIESDLKRRAERVLARLGLSTSDAVTLLFRQIDLKKGLPFDVTIPRESADENLQKGAEKAFKRVWDNSEDEIWNDYL